ncbi:amino acid-binding protein [Stappia sp. GBMRC 2046]|uniref:Amino acid-binding protein n=1 Tax=Stappia sediminis TaxID=2692190 RepID=A0A7X3S9S2_9HYPH|nr:glycine betaine ABC transporter substrate-binding protein [Stappia sediminis]MXN67183.1 amino acid-binding protein [Stappia sediminis]
MKATFSVTVQAAIISCLLAFSSSAQADKLVIGVPAWPSAQVTANIIAMSVKDRLGVETDLQERGTLTILGEIGSGDIDVHPEIWLPNLSQMVERMSKDEGPLRLSQIGVDATQNICVTRGTAASTGIKAVSDLTRPEIAEQFDSDGDGKGEIWIGAKTWSSTEIERIRAHSYGYDKTMNLLEMPEDVAMAAVDAAVAISQPIVFYCYGPHHVFELHDIVTLEEPPYDASHWTIVKRADDPQWLEKSTADTAWDRSHFHIGYATRLEKDMPQVAEFLNRISFDPSDTTAMSYAVVVEGKSPQDVAKSWIEANGDRIGEWMK